MMIRISKGTVIAAGVALCLLLRAADPTEAAVIDVPLGGSTSGFNVIATYRGQTFVALPGLAEELTFYLSRSVDAGGVNFRVLLTEVDTSGGGIILTTVLFESATLNTGTGSSSPLNPFTVELGGIPMVAGQTYAWILDAFVELESNPGFRGADNGLHSIFPPDFYPDGIFIEKNLGPFPVGTRDEHFASGFGGLFPFTDMAFKLTFSDVIIVAVDIKPRSDQNTINLSSAGVIPVAILSTETFDATTVDEGTIFLAGANVKLAGQSGEFSCQERDVNSDGYVDLVCDIETAEFMIELGEDTVELTAVTFEETPIIGTGSIRIVPD